MSTNVDEYRLNVCLSSTNAGYFGRFRTGWKGWGYASKVPQSYPRRSCSKVAPEAATQPSFGPDWLIRAGSGPPLAKLDRNVRPTLTDLGQGPSQIGRARTTLGNCLPNLVDVGHVLSGDTMGGDTRATGSGSKWQVASRIS